jgi:hypothetical protein
MSLNLPHGEKKSLTVRELVIDIDTLPPMNEAANHLLFEFQFWKTKILKF